MLIRVKDNSGFTILEVLIAAFLTAVLASAVFSFYVRMNAQSEAQFSLSEAQHLCRTSIADMKKNLRMAGYKLPSGHPPFTIGNDSLIVYFQGTQPVDTLVYYLDEFTSSEYARVPNHDRNTALYKLYKKLNSSQAQIYADFLLGMDIDTTSSGVSITIVTQTTSENLARYDAMESSGYGDDDDDDDDDDSNRNSSNYESYTMSERVKVRNL